MDYLEKLLKEFPDTPKNIILKADATRRGIKENDDLMKASIKYCSTGLAAKLQVALLKKSAPPAQFHFKADETSVDIQINENSPYEIREKSDGNYTLYCGTEECGQVRFTKRPKYADKTTSDGQEIPYMLCQRGSFCFTLGAIDFCAYQKKGENCKYCFIPAAMEAGVDHNVLKAIPDYDILAEAVETGCEDIKLKDLKLSGGGLYNLKKEAGFYKKCLKTILDRIEMPEEITIVSQAFEMDDLQDLKDIGTTNILMNLEVWNEKLWPELLPGKSKTLPKEAWIKRLEDSVNIFGRGRVGSNFVAGFECARRPGYLSEDEGLKSYIEAFEFLLKRDIVPTFTMMTSAPILSEYSDEEIPHTEFFLRLGQEHHELMEKYNMYPDLGFREMGTDPKTLGLYCYYCYSLRTVHDYPRLIGRKKKKVHEKTF